MPRESVQSSGIDWGQGITTVANDLCTHALTHLAVVTVKPEYGRIAVRVGIDKPRADNQTGSVDSPERQVPAEVTDTSYCTAGDAHILHYGSSTGSVDYCTATK